MPNRTYKITYENSFIILSVQKSKVACSTGNCISHESYEAFKMACGFMEQVILLSKIQPVLTSIFSIKTVNSRLFL